MPRATGTKIEASPAAKTRVRKTTLERLLNIVPKYEGKRKVIQQGANRATMPPKNDAVNETPKKRFGIIFKASQTSFCGTQTSL